MAGRSQPGRVVAGGMRCGAGLRFRGLPFVASMAGHQEHLPASSPRFRTSSDASIPACWQAARISRFAGALQAADRTGRLMAATPTRRGIRRSNRFNRGNVKNSRSAWSYDTGEKGDTQTQPIVVGRVMYAYTPRHKAIALDAASGRLLWTFDSGIEGTGANRGLMYWRGGRDARVFAAVDNFVYALDAGQRQVDRSLRQGRAHRPAREPRAGSGRAVRPANYAGSHLARCP